MNAKNLFDKSHPVAIAVEPLRAATMDKAQQFAEKMVADALADLAAHEGDAHKAAPYPKSTLCTVAYKIALNDYKFIRRITDSVGNGYRRPNDPEMRKANQESIAKFIAETRENASFQYDAFICKMIAKIGACETAKLEGSHVWGYSFLTIDGRDIWKTQQIVNVSKLGLPFNQWPSRKVKTKI